MPISRITLAPTPASGNTCEASIDRPIAAAIEVSASTTGTTATANEPNTTSRVTSVIGSAITSVRARSSSRSSPTPLLMDGLPVSSTRTPGCAARTAAVWACRGSTWSLPWSSGPFIVTSTRTAEPSFDRTGADTDSTSGSRSIRAAASRAAASAAAPVPVISTCSTGFCCSPPSAAIASARPASPMR
ncbi:hypothetical protein LUX57_35355 [Actinomadura madurae]|nr:hypothetical protein [Actinomadura madurae]MCP9969819.1 hypothetical protein [Actinomadura madurae]